METTPDDDGADVFGDPVTIDPYAAKRARLAAHEREAWSALTPDERKRVARILSGRRSLEKELKRTPVPTPDRATKRSSA